MQNSPQLVKKLLLWVAALAVLGAVFMAYLRPEFMVDLANQIWMCF
jgi:cytochrome b561